MSLILEALRKAERERGTVAAPLASSPSPPSSRRRERLPMAAVAVALLLVAAGFAASRWRGEEEHPAPAASAPAPAPAAPVPAVEPPTVAAPNPPPRVEPPPEPPADLPEAGSDGLPDYPLNVHVYAADPARRFVFIDGRRYQEGEALADGTRLERIVPEGVLLLARDGRRFRLSTPR